MRHRHLIVRRLRPAMGRLMVLVLAVIASAIFSHTSGAKREAPNYLGAARASAVPADNEEIQHLIELYAVSIDAADTKLASQIWLDSPNVSFIHPLGHEHGFEEIKQNVYGRLMGEIFSERKLTTRDVSVHVYGDGAWAEFYWDFSAKFRKDGTPITTHGRETQVYWKTPAGWRLVHVHYSGMPVTDQRKGF
jgi:ketosteroid isomerase-like protein